MHLQPPAYSWRPIVAGLGVGLVLGASPFASDLPLAQQVLFGLGLVLTCLSIGVLITLLPRVGPGWSFGLLVGFLYSLPGSVLVAVPYPLRPDAHAFYLNVAAGGAEGFIVSMVYGAVVGLVCGLSLPRRRERTAAVGRTSGIATT